MISAFTTPRAAAKFFLAVKSMGEKPRMIRHGPVWYVGVHLEKK